MRQNKEITKFMKAFRGILGRHIGCVWLTLVVVLMGGVQPVRGQGMISVKFKTDGVTYEVTSENSVRVTFVDATDSVAIPDTTGSFNVTEHTGVGQ